MPSKRIRSTPTTTQLQMQIDEIARRPDVIVPAERVMADGEIITSTIGVPSLLAAPEAEEQSAGEPFSRWLLTQQDRGDWIDELAKAARADRAFPKNADPDEVRRYIGLRGGDGEVFEQIDDAERCWSSI